MLIVKLLLSFALMGCESLDRLDVRNLGCQCSGKTECVNVWIIGGERMANIERVSRLRKSGPVQPENVRRIHQPIASDVAAVETGLGMASALAAYEQGAGTGIRRKAWPADTYLAKQTVRGVTGLHRYHLVGGNLRINPWVWPSNPMLYGDWEVVGHEVKAEKKVDPPTVDAGDFDKK